MQAAYFFCIPKFLNIDLSAAVFLIFSISGVVPALASIGSQFDIIKSLALEDNSTFYKSNTIFFLGYAIIILLAPIVSIIYKNSDISILAMLLFLLPAYSRLYVDSYLQGIGKFDISQRNYIIYWCLKFLVILAIYRFKINVTLTYLAVFEIILLPIWISSILPYSDKIKFDTKIARSHVMNGALSAFTSFSRGLWLELDKLVLPSLINNSTYVTYSIIARVFTAGISIISSFLSKITPNLISANETMLGNIVKSAKFQVGVTTIVTLIGYIITALLYPSVREHGGLMLLFLLCVPVFFVSSVYLDFIFYKKSVFLRLISNFLGSLAVLCSLFLISSYGITTAGIGYFISFLTTTYFAFFILYRNGE